MLNFRCKSNHFFWSKSHWFLI